MNTLRIFNHHIHIKFVILGIVHFALAAASVYAATEIRYVGDDAAMMRDYAVLMWRAVFFAVVVVACLSAMGVYRPQRQNRHVPVLVRVVAAMVMASLVAAFAFYVLPGLFLGRGILLMALVLSLIGLSIVQLGFYALIDQRSAPWRVLFYGAGHNAAETLAYMRRRSDHSLFNLVGCILAPGETPQVDSQLVLHADCSLAEYARRHRIDEIVVTMDDRRHQFPSDDLIDCRIAGVNIVDTLTFYERQTGKVKTELLQPSWIIFSHGFRRSFAQDAVKRLLDLAVASVLLAIVWPIMLATAIAILVEDGLRQPVLFRQRRVGLNGGIYWIYKFRSMRTDAETPGVAQWASVDDPRVTRVGFYIRKYRLDELPQLWNVFKGDMSLVGPRPERPEFVDQLADTLPYYRVRECVKPGITGWAQLGYPYGASEEDANGKLQHDLYYVKNRSFFLDLLILMNTVEVVLFRKGGR
ncbi:TIGR03013 family XrtA/PEP-CTERM system glycosyltransferase [Salinisphaera orenii]|uniref:UDP-phosphate galactose phosphotransferase n=1 Tax=Salinisphaera orenii YIM 95161 TaxID=1051139 RepID=A0A423Q337_9GAMM|nr:TIGR03013 family XrtA/PEP-CTERM system glycosyltransferase [Salinisphaera halophila]ROO33081.1 UDP-phosphate galactose phosphotransferase [Salinisphaera halophila YIM 95161]